MKMSAGLTMIRACVALLAGLPSSALAQRNIPGEPSRATPNDANVIEKADDIGGKIGTVSDNVNLLADFIRGEKIKSHLTEYLERLGANPTPGQIHVFYVQAYVGENGEVWLKDYQYLAYGRTGDDALREAFAVEGSPATTNRLDTVPLGTKLVGIYMLAHPEDGAFVVRAEMLDNEHFSKLHKEALDLRDKRAKERAEAKRIEEIRQKRVATHAASDGESRRQLDRDRNTPHVPGPALSPSTFPTPDRPIFPPPSPSSAPKSSPQSQPLGPAEFTTVEPRAHPPVDFFPRSTTPSPPAQQPELRPSNKGPIIKPRT